MASKEDLARHQLDDISRRIQPTVEARAKISRRRSGLTAAKSVGLQLGSEANDEGASLSQRRASLGDKDNGVPSLSAGQILQGRLREARARIRTKVHEPSITHDEPKSSSSTPTISRAKATRRSSLPKLLQQHMANDSMASVAKSYAASPRDNNVHLFDTDVDLLPSAPIWSSHSGSATSTSRTVQQSRSYSSSDESLSISELGDSILLEEVAKELASSAPRHDSSGEIVITAGGNRKLSGEYADDFHDDDDSLQGCIAKAEPLSDVDRVDGEDCLHIFMKKFSM